MGNLKEIFFVRLFIILDCKNSIIHFNNLRGRGVNSKLAYFIHTYVRGFVATRPPYSDVYVHHYVYIGGVQPSADTSFSALMEYRR